MGGRRGVALRGEFVRAARAMLLSALLINHEFFE